MFKSLFASLCLAVFATLAGPVLANESPAAPAAQVQTLNINTATAEQLQAGLVGIGAVKAQAIVEYREEHGPFASVEELLEVKGIGAATLEKNRDRLSVQ